MIISMKFMVVSIGLTVDSLDWPQSRVIETIGGIVDVTEKLREKGATRS
jgi:hypothetical protein